MTEYEKENLKQNLPSPQPIQSAVNTFMFNLKKRKLKMLTSFSAGDDLATFHCPQLQVYFT